MVHFLRSKKQCHLKKFDFTKTNTNTQLQNTINNRSLCKSRIRSIGQNLKYAAIWLLMWLFIVFIICNGWQIPSDYHFHCPVVSIRAECYIMHLMIFPRKLSLDPFHIIALYPFRVFGSREKADKEKPQLQNPVKCP